MTTTPLAGPDFFKGHGLGNDYLVFASGDAWAVTAEAVRHVCDRWRGVGGDGIVLQVGEGGPPFRLRMFNPDGTEFERSGNGLRVFAASVASLGKVDREPFVVEVGGDEVRMTVHGRTGAGDYDVSVDMGIVSLDAADAGLSPDRLPTGRFEHEELGTLDATVASVGNPHCVVFTEDVSHGMLERIGPFLTAHPAFPNGVNVQVARATSRRAIEIGIWERGVGPTSASGTSSCAAAAVAVARRLVDPGEVEVRMPGGTFEVTVSPDLEVVLRGPVQGVMRGRLETGFLEAVAGAGGGGTAATSAPG